MPPLLRLAAPIVAFALPSRCPACGTVVDGDARFCAPCWQGFRWLDGQGCAACRAPMEAAGEGALCASCLERPPRHDGVRAAVAYDARAAAVALKLKYGRRTGVAAVIARALRRHVADGEDALLVPVPLHRWRLWQRGFNQSALIAARLGRLTGLPADPLLLRRTKRTPVLRGLGRRDRARALRGAVAVDPARRARLAGAHVLLVDDVYTTGATAEACATVLKRAGAARVEVLCWARVLPDDDAWRLV